jgi:hypothetical protein
MSEACLSERDRGTRSTPRSSPNCRSSGLWASGRECPAWSRAGSAFVRIQVSTHPDDPSVNVLAVQLEDFEFQLSVVHLRMWLPGTSASWSLGTSNGIKIVLRARSPGFLGGTQGDHLIGFQSNEILVKLPMRRFWTLQVHKNRNRFAELFPRVCAAADLAAWSSCVPCEKFRRGNVHPLQSARAACFHRTAWTKRGKRFWQTVHAYTLLSKLVSALWQFLEAPNRVSPGRLPAEGQANQCVCVSFARIPSPCNDSQKRRGAAGFGFSSTQSADLCREFP